MLCNNCSIIEKNPIKGSDILTDNLYQFFIKKVDPALYQAGPTECEAGIDVA